MCREVSGVCLLPVSMCPLQPINGLNGYMLFFIFFFFCYLIPLGFFLFFFWSRTNPLNRAKKDDSKKEQLWTFFNRLQAFAILASIIIVTAEKVHENWCFSAIWARFERPIVFMVGNLGCAMMRSFASAR